DGIIRAVIASISTASSGVKNSNFAGFGEAAAACACVAAETIAGHCAVSQAAERPATPRVRKVRRSKGTDGGQSVSDMQKLYASYGERSIQNSRRAKMDF